MGKISNFIANKTKEEGEKKLLKLGIMNRESVKDAEKLVKVVKEVEVSDRLVSEGILQSSPFKGSFKGHKPMWVSNPLPRINTDYFREAAINFKNTGLYCPYPKETFLWSQWWRVERDRCINGFSTMGVKITGRHYFYLNYYPILATVQVGNKSRKENGLPRFLDMDYYYFWEVEHAMEAGESLTVLKARRKGFSFKNSLLVLWEFTFQRDSKSMVAAYYEDYALETMNMFAFAADYMIANTEFGKLRIKSAVAAGEYKSGYIETVNGQQIIKGMNTTAYSVTFKQNTSAGIGKSFSLALWEEAGKFPNLLDSYRFTMDALKDGGVSTGTNIVFGTGGDMEGGSTSGFSELYNNPQKYDMRAYDASEFDHEVTGVGGLFISDAWYKLPNVDAMGYSKFDLAVEANLKERLEKYGSDSSRDLEMFKTQHPLTPREGFLIMGSGYFPVDKIRQQIERIGSSKYLLSLAKRGTLSQSSSGVHFQKDDDLREAAYPYDKSRITGCVVIYEEPELINGLVPKGLYIAATDPYMHDDAKDSTSLGSTLVYKRFLSTDKTSDIIVAEYTGHPDTTADYYETVRLLLIYYNAKCLYENQFKDMKTHFEHKGSLHLLAYQPTIIKDVIRGSNVSRIYGTHMPRELKVFGLTKIKEWLNKNKSPEVSVISEIYSIYLLKELLDYGEGNFDRVSALIVLMIYIEETYKMQVKELNAEPVATPMSEFMNKIFNKTKDPYGLY